MMSNECLGKRLAGRVASSAGGAGYGLALLATAGLMVFAGCGGGGTPEDDCEKGYEWDDTVCVDIDECADRTDNCADNAACTNTEGSFTCECRPGFSGDGIECTDIDECVDGTDDCAAIATCFNTPGAFNCTCPSGWEGDGTACGDIDECDDARLFDCAEDASCENRDGSYDCVCNSGFEGDGLNCTDIDECETGDAECDENAFCQNTPGSFTCKCNEGYDGTGTACADIDECDTGDAECDENATCTNTDGSYTCDCNDGYDGDGKSCADIDECIAGVDECSLWATCTNMSGSYDCTCGPGFDGDGRTCNDITHWLAVAFNGGGLGMVDTDTGVVHGPFMKARIGTSGGGNFDVVVTPDGNTALVSNFGDSQIHFIDITVPDAPVALGRLQMPMFAEDIAISPDGRFALVTDGGFSPTVVSIDIQNRTVIEEKVEEGVFTNAVEIAPDGTVITVNYFEGSISTFVLDAAGTLTYGSTYRFNVRLNGDATDSNNAHMVRSVNVGIAPDGVTVLVPDVGPYNKEKTTLDPTPDTTGNTKFAIGVYRITAPGVLEFVNVVKDVPRAVQSMAFDRSGAHVYLLGNNGWILDRPEDTEDFLEEEMDLLMVADIESPGVVRFDPTHSANLRRYSGSQLFGVDGLVVHRGRAYASYSTISVNTPDMRSIAVVDLETFEVSRLGVGGIISGIAAVPVKTVDVAVTAGTDSCVGFCQEIPDSGIFYAGGFNRNSGCFCDDACQKWGDCCADYEAVCTGCDPETCTGDYKCANTEAGTFECACPEWTVDLGGNDCEIEDFCGAQGGDELCKLPAKCVNDMDSGYLCTCDWPMVSDWINGCVCADGYREDVDGGCVDIDECAEELDDCNGYATCQNFSGGFDCRCPGAPWPGMAEDGHGGCVCPGGFMEKEAAVCVDVNECALLTDECVAPATCSNTTGGYDCLCPAGSGMVPDGDNGCACPTGFLLDPFGVCQDIDECAQETDNCVEPAICNNVPGGFVCACPEGSGMVSDGHGGCVCPPGLELDETDVCVDIDECAVGTDNCVEPAECVNVPGSFNCECPEGYGYVSDGDGGCVCPDGFIDNGEVCADVD